MDKSDYQWEKAPGYVYFIGAGIPPGAIKIGVSTQKDLLSRFSAIQGSNHEPLSLLGVIVFDNGERPMKQAEGRERELHRRFAHLQLFRNGWAGSEWFAADQELETFIRESTIRPEILNLPLSVGKPGPGRALLRINYHVERNR